MQGHGRSLVPSPNQEYRACGLHVREEFQMDHLMSPQWRVRGMQILAAALLAACGGGDDTPASVFNGGSVPQVVPANGDSVPQVTPAQSCDFSQAVVMVNEMRIRQV